MKWIGQHIWDLVSRFRNEVYMEDVPNGTIVSGGNLGLDSNNKVVKATVESGSGDDAVLDTDFTTAGLMATDGSGTYSVVADNSSNWDTAYNWGDHGSAGYLTSETSHSDVLVDGDFGSAGLMATNGSGTYNIVADNSSNWDAAHGWGNHASQGYLTSETSHADVLVDGDFATAGLMTTNGSGTYSITTDNSSNWDAAYNWGNHSLAGYASSSHTHAASDITSGTLAVARGGTGQSDLANVTVGRSDNVKVSTSIDTLVYPMFAANASNNGYFTPKVDAGISYNMSTNALTVGGMTTLSGGGIVGTGLEVRGTQTAGGWLRLKEANQGGGNYIQIASPNSLLANNTYTLPNAYPTASGQVLSSTTTGAMSWVTAGSGNDTDTQKWSINFGGRTAALSNSTSYYTFYRPEYDYWGNLDTTPTTISGYDWPAAVFTVPYRGTINKMSVSGYASSNNSSDSFKLYLYKAPASNNANSITMTSGFGLMTASITPYGNGRTFSSDTTWTGKNNVDAGDRIFCWIKKNGHVNNTSVYMTITLTGTIE